MRKAQKEQVIEFLVTLSQAHDEIKKNIEHGNVSDAANLLVDCQQYAITLGGIIEQSEGEGFVTVSYLEEYCETLYRIYEKLSGGGEITAVKARKLLEQILVKIDNSVRHDIQIRKEAVFLPYKASMWDSLESIWRELDSDPGWDVYVVPIPYYDKKPDKSFGQMHYEGDRYPEDVPVLDYRSFNLQDRHPDRIYIHNPYDEYNYVTSVEPAYYSKQLRKYTDELIYIPYFVLGDIDPDDDAAVESISHFVMVPGVINSHRVIVQSENMRQAYIKIMTNQTGENTREYWENKIDGSGSPKLDRIAATKITDKDIPPEWLKLIVNPDGSRKKVMLYNTSVSALLKYSDRYIDKMKRVFETFKEYRESIVLLWRPHPLIEATISSMRPELWQEYEKLVEEYIQAGWGIYDDTPELDRAIAMSDAYYGDASSVVQLCQKVNKMIMIQNVEM